MGMTPDKDRSTGAFFFAVGEPFPEMTVNRIGHVRLRDQIKGKHDRDDEDEDDDGKPRGQDDDDDDDGKKNADDDDDDNDGIHDVFDDDDDNDGIENEHDTKDNKESKQNHRSSLSSSQAEEFDVAASPNALLLLATAIADEPLTPISLEVVNAATGQVVGSSPAAPGAAVVTILAPTAGSYIVRVKNMGVTNAGIATSILTREPRLP